VGAGLYPRERKYVLSFAPVSFVLFLLGCAFGYFILIPYALFGLGRMLDLDIVDARYSFSEYLSLVTTFTIFLGALFQLPLVMTLLSKLGLVSPTSYARWRKGAIVAMAVAAAILTPADGMTMVLVLVPLVLLYEIGVAASRWAI
jgi:sec-independent protein translocase protein TatC